MTVSWPQCRAHRTKSRHKRRLQSFCQCNGASITYLVVSEVHHGDGLVCLVVYNQCWQATGGTCASPNDYKAAKPAVSTPRQPRESDSYVCAFRLPAPATEVSLQCHACEVAWSAVECRVLVCRLTRARPCSWCRGTTSAVMLWSLVLHIVPPTHVHSGHTTQISTPTGSLSPVHHEQFQPPLAGSQT